MAAIDYMYEFEYYTRSSSILFHRIRGNSTTKQPAVSQFRGCRHPAIRGEKNLVALVIKNYSQQRIDSLKLHVPIDNT